MGERMLKYYQYITENQGVSGKILLAQKTKMPSTKATFEPDSKENLELFKKAIEEILKKPAPIF